MGIPKALNGPHRGYSAISIEASKHGEYSLQWEMEVQNDPPPRRPPQIGVKKGSKGQHITWPAFCVDMEPSHRGKSKNVILLLEFSLCNIFHGF